MEENSIKDKKRFVCANAFYEKQRILLLSEKNPKL